MSDFMNEVYMPKVDPADEMGSYVLSEKLLKDYKVVVGEPFPIDVRGGVLQCQHLEVKYDERRGGVLHRFDVRDGEKLVASAGMTVEDDVLLDFTKKVVTLGMPTSIQLEDDSSIQLGGDLYVREDCRRRGIASVLVDIRCTVSCGNGY